MRITGGQARGIPLTTGRARHVRPATDRMREAVFSSLGPAVNGATFLDLFAGSGSYGLEALSRGASGGVFVEKHPQAAAALQANLEAVLKSLGRPRDPGLKVLRLDALRLESTARYDLVFMDPPYELARTHLEAMLDRVAGTLLPEGILVCELPADLAWSHPAWHCRKRIGKSGTNEPSVSILEVVKPHSAD